MRGIKGLSESEGGVGGSRSEPGDSEGFIWSVSQGDPPLALPVDLSRSDGCNSKLDDYPGDNGVRFVEWPPPSVE